MSITIEISTVLFYIEAVCGLSLTVYMGPPWNDQLYNLVNIMEAKTTSEAGDGLREAEASARPAGGGSGWQEAEKTGEGGGGPLATEAVRTRRLRPARAGSGG
jgi:hypothetical protein